MSGLVGKLRERVGTIIDGDSPVDIRIHIRAEDTRPGREARYAAGSRQQTAGIPESASPVRLI